MVIGRIFAFINKGIACSFLSAEQIKHKRTFGEQQICLLNICFRCIAPSSESNIDILGKNKDLQIFMTTEDVITHINLAIICMFLLILVITQSTWFFQERFSSIKTLIK